MRRAFTTAVFALVHVVSVESANAESAPGFALDRFEPSERSQDWFVGDSLDYRGNARPAFGALVEWSHDPLVVYTNGERSGAIVGDQWVGHAQASVTFIERLRLSLDVPMLLGQAGDGANIQGISLSAKGGPALGDLRAGVSGRILGAYEAPFSLSFGMQAHLPTGTRTAFMSDGAVSAVPRLMAAGKLDWFVYAAQFAVRVGPQRDGWLNDTSGQAAMLAASVGVRAAPTLTVGPELWGSSEVGRGHFLSRTSTPMEVLLGGHYQPGDWSIGAGMGMGLGHGYGAPQMRAVLSLAYTPVPAAESRPDSAPPILDRDHDGVTDARDACVDVPGVASDDPGTNGCPPPPDGDHDGVSDALDACPTEAGVATSDPKTNGCPAPRDRDHDGVFDESDACPDEAGVATQDAKTNGCPLPPDRDEDGIIDSEDACPDAPGPSAKEPEKNGCPLARIESAQIVILEAVRFGNNSDVILPASEPVLRAVLGVIDNHAEIGALEVHGHTDDKGSASYNLQLSRRRAAAVAKWLVRHGLAKSRITSFGFGKTRPLVANDSESNRQRNRRVEFHIIPKSE